MRSTLCSVRDVGSTNGTYVNDELVQEINLRDGDQIKVGRTILKFITGGNIEASYHEEIYRLMTVDGLTEVHNKRYFHEMLDREAPAVPWLPSHERRSASRTSSSPGTPVEVRKSASASRSPR